MRSRASLVTEASVAKTEISVTVMKIFPYEHSSLVTEMKLFIDKEATHSQHSGQNSTVLVLHVCLL